MSASSRPRPRVRVTRRLPESVERVLLSEFDAELNASDAPSSPESLAAALAETDAVLGTVTDRFDAALFARRPRARIIANFGVGVNHIALEAATDAGVIVTNTPGVLTDDTADLALFLMLAVMRRAGEGERELRDDRWSGWRPTHLMGTRLTGKTLGIVGLGRIGTAVARRAHFGFGMKVLAWTRSAREAAPEGVERVPTLAELLERSDVVSLHCPATPETRHLMNAERLGQMRPGAVLVNTARGDVVDEQALVLALESGALGGAGLDVYEQEPVVHPGLLRREDVVLLPHLGSATEESRTAMGMRAIENLRAHFRGEEPPDRLN